MGKLVVIPRQTFIFANTTTSNNITLVNNNCVVYTGTAYETLIEIPDWTNNVTLTYVVKDPTSNNVSLVASSNHVKNQTGNNCVRLFDPYPVFPGVNVNLSLNAAPGANGGNAYVTIYYRK